MPGIVGIIRRIPYEGIEADLRFMTGVMKHERFYTSGEYTNADVGLYAGWTSHQDSFADCMPVVCQNGNVVIVLQGENYVDRDTLARLRNKHGVIDESNAKYLGLLYDEFGNDFLRRLNGWFSGFIVNLESQRITLFNDRYGMGRIYYHEGNGEFLFASEAKALLRVRPNLRTMDVGSVAQYLRCDCVMDNKTLFKDVSVLPNGSAWIFDRSDLREKRRYFHFSEWEQQHLLEPDDLYDNFNEVASSIFPRYAQSSQKVAMSLTAGLDTRAIMASLQVADRSLPSYTFGGPWGETFDIQTARKVAQVVNQQHDVIRINGEFFDDFPTLAQRTIYISDGTHNAFGAHDLYFNQMARNIAPIRLTGKFGSEVVRVRRMIPWMTFPRELLQEELKSALDEAVPLEKVSQTPNLLSRAVCEEIPWYEFGRVAIEQSQVALRTPYMDNDLVKLMFQAPPGFRAKGGLQARYVKDKSPDLNVILTNLSRSGESHPLIKEIVYIAFWSLFKAEYIYLFATPHWVTRIDRKLEKLRPERFLSGRQKFEGYRIWIRSYLGEFIRETLQNRHAQFANFFDRKSVLKMVDRHIAGTHNYLNEINKVLTIELICSSLLKNSSEFVELSHGGVFPPIGNRT